MEVKNMLQIAVRRWYVKAQQSKLMDKIAPPPGSLRDRALNNVLGFSSQRQRLTWLQITTNFQAAQKTRGLEQNQEIDCEGVFNDVMTFGRWFISELSGIASDVSAGAALTFQDVSRYLYVRAQYYGKIPTLMHGRSIKRGSFLDINLNTLLGFKNQQERLSYLLDQFINIQVENIVAEQSGKLERIVNEMSEALPEEWRAIKEDFDRYDALAKESDREFEALQQERRNKLGNKK